MPVRSRTFARIGSMAVLALFAGVSFVSADQQKDDSYTTGKTWLGDAQESKGNLKQIRLKERNGNRVAFVFQGAVAGAFWTTSGLLNNGIVSLDILNRTANPPGHEGMSVKNVTGSARINQDGSLDLAVEGRAFGDGPSNRKISATFVNAQPK